MNRSSRLPLAVSLLLAGCAGAGEPEECNTFAECDRLLVAAQVDGRPLFVTIDADGRNGWYRSGDSMVTVQVIAFRPSLLGGEGVHLWLDGFHGVGAYRVDDDYLPGQAMAGYWREDLVEPVSYWGRGSAGDSVWVTAYDSTSGAIEGSFRFHGEGGGRTVEVTDGAFSGVVEP